MTSERRAEIVKILEESRECFEAALAGFTGERARISPGPGQWSTLEIAEHVAIAETGMFRLLRSAQPVELSLENPEREARLASQSGTARTPVQAPERAHPTGRFADLPHALNQFRAARENTIQHARETETDLFRVSANHPLFGPVSGYELLLIMAGHARRHADQIKRIPG